MSSSDRLVGLLNESLDPTKAKFVQQNLEQFESEPGFSIELLRLTSNGDLSGSIRLAAALSFKNLIRRKWTDASGNYLLPINDVNAIKTEILNIMINLPIPNLRAQLGEAISIIADSDFPDRWKDLIPSLTSKLGSDPKINNGVLVIAHSIFKRWRPLFRSNGLMSEIAFVLTQFTQPYLDIMMETHKRITSSAPNAPELPDLLRTMSLLIEIFYDLNCQDIPEFFEDNIKSFMEFLKFYLTYQNPVIDSQTDEDQIGILEEIRANICEALQLYTLKYEEEFTSFVQEFSQLALQLLVSLGPQSKYDLVANKALGFLTSVVKLPTYLPFFESSLEQLIEQVIIPNIILRDQDEELFEDDPIEYIRRDLEGADDDTRRRAATDFLRELAATLESKVTPIVLRLVQAALTQYEQNPTQNWRSKHTATYLFSAIAAKGIVTSHGVSTTNLQVDIVEFFSKSIAPDLFSNANPVHPILQVDAIKYIHNFRNQLTKEQLSNTLPVLSQLLGSKEYVVYTYAAVTIERILSIRVNNELLFAKSDIEPVAKSLIDELMRLIFKNASSPEKLSENEFLAKCIMRILILVQDGSAPFADTLMPAFIELVNLISHNPSNPRFTHYLFECIGALIKYNRIPFGNLDNIVVNPLLGILGRDVTEFVPYVLQILALILRQQPQQEFPDTYRQLLRPLMSAQLWEPRGNVPALVGIMQVILEHGAQVIVQDDFLRPLLGIFQKLLSMKSSDSHGVDLIEYVFTFVPKNSIRPLSKDIAQLFMMRLQSFAAQQREQAGAATDKFVARFARLVYFISASNPSQNGLGPEFAIDLLDQVQNGVFGQIFQKFLLPNTLKIGGVHHRRTAALGLTNLLCKTQQFTVGSYVELWPRGVDTMVGLLRSNIAERLQDTPLHFDAEELSFGSSFSKLSTCATKDLDPVPGFTGTPAHYFKEALGAAVRDYSSTLQPQLQSVDEDSRQFLQSEGF